MGFHASPFSARKDHSVGLSDPFPPVRPLSAFETETRLAVLLPAGVIDGQSAGSLIQLHHIQPECPRVRTGRHNKTLGFVVPASPMGAVLVKFQTRYSIGLSPWAISRTTSARSVSMLCTRKCPTMVGIPQ